MMSPWNNDTVSVDAGLLRRLHLTVDRRNTCGTPAGLFVRLSVAIGPVLSVVSAFVIFTANFGLASKPLLVYVSAQSGRSAAW